MPEEDLDQILQDFEKGLDLDGDNAGADKGTPDLKAIQAELAELKKQNAGLLNETKAQRRKRQEAEAQVAKYTETLTGILGQRSAALEQIAAAAAPQKAADVVKFDYDADGNPVAKADQIKQVISPEIQQMQQRIAFLEGKLQETNVAQEAQTQAQRLIEGIVGSDERFGPAYQRYQTARQWVENKVLEYQEENNIEGFISSGQALDYIFDDKLEAEFAGKFPGMNLERIVTAEDSQRHLRNTLSTIAETMTPQNKGRFQKVLGKPTSHGRATNQKGGALSLQERLSSLTQDDILGLDDKSVKQLESLLAKEETD